MESCYFPVYMARYQNPHLPNIRRTFWDVLLWKLGYYRDPILRKPPARDFCYPASPAPFERGKPSALWIGHSTFLVEVEGLSILTDPVWSHYCAPVPFPTLRRKSDPPFTLSDLPPIDFVLQSHNHYDHLDSKVVSHFRTFYPETVWIVPLGLGKWFQKRGIKEVRELNWWENHSSEKASITAVPAQHFSGRGILDRNKTFWNGYVLETKKKRFYFTGDTGYNFIDFKAIGNRWPSMDLSLIPIGTYSPKKFMEPVHISPYEAVEIHKDVKSLFSIGMHWKTFRLSEEPLDRPPYDLFLAMREAKIPFEEFLPVEIGLYVNW